MAFHFSLESLLRYRRSLEHKCELKLHRAAAEVSRIQRELENVNLAEGAMRHSEDASLRLGVRASELQWNGLQRSAFRSHRLWLEKKLQEAELIRSACFQDLLCAKQQYEIVEQLRQQRWGIYRMEDERRAQRQLDDLFLSRGFWLTHSSARNP